MLLLQTSLQLTESRTYLQAGRITTVLDILTYCTKHFLSLCLCIYTVVALNFPMGLTTVRI